MYNFKFADIGEGIHEGKILKWFFKEGDQVKEGETLCLVETDKVNAEIPSPADGKVFKIPFKEGDMIEVGQTLVKIDDGTGVDEAKEEKLDKNKQVVKEEKNAKTEPVTEGEENSAGVVGEIEVSSEVIESSDENEESSEADEMTKVLATPVARRLAKDLGIDITTIRGSGPMGRVMKEDIYKASERKQDIPKQKVEPLKIKETGVVERIPMTKLRKTIASNMVQSRTIIPHTTAMDEFDVTKLVLFRKEQKPLAEKNGIHLTYMPFIVKALTLVLKEFVYFNASYDMEKEEIVLKKYYNIGIAVDTNDGLIVPVIKDADKKSILKLADEIDKVAKATRDRIISLDLLKDGTFTITNYGAVGCGYGVPVIRYPEVAILGIGKIEKKPVIRNDEITTAYMMPVSLSIDHRIVDGGDAGRFLMKLKEYLNDPMFLLMS